MKPISEKQSSGKRTGLIVVMLLLGVCTVFSAAQKRFMMNENEEKKFKLAKNLYYKGEQLFKKDKLKKAEKAFTDCLEKFPKYSNASFFLSQIHYKANRFEEAMQHIRTAKDNFSFMAKLGASTQLQYMEMLRENETELNEHVMKIKDAMAKMSAGSSGYQEWESELNRYQGSLNQVREKMRNPVIKTAQTPAEYYYLHGNICVKIKKLNDAYAQYMKTIEIDPKHGNAYVNLANLHYNIKKYQKALEYLNKAEKCGTPVNAGFKAAIQKGLKQQQ
ncbi:MAG: tetratricopeptide repeat protein [bacterium]|nr:tetratricopeptide repeat protein [bacterium]